MAYAARIGDRLRAATDEETASFVDERDAAGPANTPDTSRALVRVLADRSAEVDALMDELFPDLVTKESRATPDWHGWEAGRNAANSATLFGAASTLDQPDTQSG